MDIYLSMDVLRTIVNQSINCFIFFAAELECVFAKARGIAAAAAAAAEPSLPELEVEDPRCKYPEA